MNVLNLIEDIPQWNKPIAAPPAPYTATPYVDEQVNNVFGEAPVFDPNAQPVMQVVPQEPTPNFAARYEENMRNGLPALAGILDKGTPPLDEKRQQRLKLAAGLNALGQGMSTLYGGYIGAKGGPIMAQDNKFTPAALQEYNARIDADRDAKYRNAMAKFQFGSEVYGQTSRQMELDENRKMKMEIQAAHDKAILEAKKYSEKSGKTFEEESNLLDQKYDRMDKHAQIGYMYRTKLDAIKNDNSLNLAEKKFEFAKALEEYKAGIIKTKTTTVQYDNSGNEIKTDTETNVAPPVEQPEPLKRNQNPSRQPNEPKKKEIDLSGIPGAKIGFKPKGSPKYKIQSW